VVDPIEERRQVNIHHNVAALLDIALRSHNRVLGASARTEAVTVFAEGGIDPRLQHLQQCLLNQAIGHGGNTQFTLTSIRLWDAYPAHRLWPVGALQQLLAKSRPGPSQVLGCLVNIPTVDTCRALCWPLRASMPAACSLVRMPAPAGLALRPPLPVAGVLFHRWSFLARLHLPIP